MPDPDTKIIGSRISAIPKFDNSEQAAKSSKEAATDGDDLQETPRPRRKLKRKAESSPVITIDSDDSEEPVVSSPVKRQRHLVDAESPRTPRSSAQQDEMDIEEDLKDLQDSGMGCPSPQGLDMHGSPSSQLSRRVEHEAGLLGLLETRGSNTWKLSGAGGPA